MVRWWCTHLPLPISHGEEESECREGRGGEGDGEERVRTPSFGKKRKLAEDDACDGGGGGGRAGGEGAVKMIIKNF